MAAAYVQSGIRTGVSSGNTFTFGSSVTTGNTLLAATIHYGGCPPSLTDSLGNTWSSVGSQPSDPTNPSAKVFVYAAKSIGTGTCIVTFTMGCGTSDFYMMEASGILTTPFDVQNVASNTTSPCGCGSITPSVNGEFIMACFYRSGSVASSYTTNGTFIVNTTIAYGALCSYVQPTAGAITPAVLASGVSVAYPVIGFAASFKPSAGTAYNSTLTDAFTVSDIIRKQAGKFVSDPFTLSDSLLRAITRLVNDTLTQTDRGLTRAMTYRFIEAFIVSDRLVQQGIVASEAFTLLDSIAYKILNDPSLPYYRQYMLDLSSVANVGSPMEITYGLTDPAIVFFLKYLGAAPR